MNNLNMNRLANVARWDVTVNRQSYIKYGMLIVGVYVVIAMYTYVVASISWPAEYFDDAFYVRAIMATFGTVHWLQTLLVMSAIFHGLHTRQGRINQLTLPATNQERFAWNVLRTLFANVVLYAVGVIVADALHCVYLILALGPGVQLSSISYYVAKMWTDFFFVPKELIGTDGAAGLLIATGLLFLSRAFVATFALGSAWKYRRSFATTILYHICFWLVAVLGVMLLIAVVGTWVPDSVLMHLRFLTYVDKWQWAFLFMLISLAVLCSVWYATYRLYCKAQITTRRNP